MKKRGLNKKADFEYKIYFWMLQLILIGATFLVLTGYVVSVSKLTLLEKNYFVKDTALAINTLYAAPGNVDYTYEGNISKYKFVMSFTPNKVAIKDQEESATVSYPFAEDKDIKFHYKENIAFEANEKLKLAKEGNEIRADKEVTLYMGKIACPDIDTKESISGKKIMLDPGHLAQQDDLGYTFFDKNEAGERKTYTLAVGSGGGVHTTPGGAGEYTLTVKSIDPSANVIFSVVKTTGGQDEVTASRSNDGCSNNLNICIDVLPVDMGTNEVSFQVYAMTGEAGLMLDLAKKIKTLAPTKGFRDIILTRETERTIEQRLTDVNQQNPSILISLHTNNDEKITIKTIVSSLATDEIQAKSRKLGCLIENNIIENPDLKDLEISIANPIAKEPGESLLVNDKISIVLEIGNVKFPEFYLKADAIAQSIVNAIDEYYTT